MSTTNRAVAATVTAVVLAAGAAGLVTTGAQAAKAPESSAGCARLEAKVVKAEKALARVTAVFERKHDAVVEAEEEVAEATATEEAEALEELADAEAAETTAKKAKKAQQMRLKKATARLEACVAAQEPTESPDPTETPEPSESTGA